MGKEIFEEIRTLTELPAVSGHEDKIIEYVYKKVYSLADEVTIDKLGNIIATFYGKITKEFSVLFFAHLDEIGLIVRKIEENGFLRFERIGGVPEKTLRGQYVDVYSIDGDKYFTGVIGTTSHHVTKDEDKFRVPSRLEMYIDVGFDSKEEVLKNGIDVGSIVTYHPSFKVVGSKRFVSKALDNRIGVYLLLKLIEYLKKQPPIFTIYIAFTIQEEFSVRGSLPVFNKTKPQIAICLDITPAGDTPELEQTYEIKLGKGPAITQMNFHGRGTLGGIIPHPKLRRFIEVTAEELKIPYQREVILGVITDDAFGILTGREGVMGAHISIPIRYTHSPIEMADVEDIENALKLLIGLIDKLNSNHSRIDLKRG
ncbi:M42 family metallopeptidase [Caldanaerobacter subterraneus]|uniref:M42 family peptidase n=1 Tax=Caldanaerobacter subterraneus subsp. pacificus DSM 12653 TaxID=391606 RepID=B7R623_9THEO|nr:M42 family peptidase [Caldanaerobacter subterraneus]KKC30734.1 M42 family peptidase [Caldanaerobacter subterraneus subsp. pacificus DSM 12653]